MLVVTRKLCHDNFQKEKCIKSWVQHILCRDTRPSCCDKKKTAGSKRCRDIIKVCRDRIKEKSQRTGRDKKLHAMTEASCDAPNPGGSFFYHCKKSVTTEYLCRPGPALGRQPCHTRSTWSVARAWPSLSQHNAAPHYHNRASLLCTHNLVTM